MLRTGSICASLIYNYFTSKNEEEKEVSSNEEHIDKLNKLKVINKTLKSYGGVLGKISQVLCITDQDNDVFSDCKPYSSEETTKNFKKNVQENPELFSDLDINFNVIKSGSVGQVYKAVLKSSNQPLIIKVQYEGLYDQVQSDLKILKTISNIFYSFVDTKDAISIIRTNMDEELSYDVELDNHSIMFDIWNDSGFVRIPKLYPEISNDKMIVMEFMTGTPINEFIKTANIEQKNQVAENITRFVFENIFLHNIFYSDLHYGNFFINDDNSISVVDFGCLQNLNDILIDNMKNIIFSLKNKDQKEFTSLLRCMGVLTPKTSVESVNYAFQYFNNILFPLIHNEDFEFTYEYTKDKINHKDPVLIKQWKLPGELVLFNRIPHTLYVLLWKLGSKINYSKILQEILDKIKEDEVI